jgi:uncharacterized membrane protein YhdT
MLKKIKSDIIGLSILTVIVWSFVVILYFLGKNPLEVPMLIVAGILFPIILLMYIYVYIKQLKSNNDNEYEE